jgi:hypothetical protein
MRGVRAVDYTHILLARHALVQAQGAWVESFWPGVFALRALTPAARWGLLRAKPELAGILYADQAPEECYGPRVRAVLPKVNIDRGACKDWSRLARDGVQSDDLSGNFCMSSGRFGLIRKTC